MKAARFSVPALVLTLLCLVWSGTAQAATWSSTDKWGTWSNGGYTLYNDVWGSEPARRRSGPTPTATGACGRTTRTPGG
ncbi:hypothetical protein GCM10029978_024470 [Actinoallomurus acanthiterrae]